MDEGNEGYKKLLTSYKNRDARVMVVTKQDFIYTCFVLDIFPDSVLFKDKYGKEILLRFENIKQLGGAVK